VNLASRISGKGDHYGHKSFLDRIRNWSRRAIFDDPSDGWDRHSSVEKEEHSVTNVSSLPYSLYQRIQSGVTSFSCSWPDSDVLFMSPMKPIVFL
jgi:hypothetical protein